MVPDVTRLGTPIVNWYLVEEGGRLTAVDAGLPDYARTLEADLEAHGHALDDIEAVVLTHADGDHFGMAAVMHDRGARVLIHRDDEARLEKPGPKSGDGAPIHLLPLVWRPAFWRFMGHMARSGGAKSTPIDDAETFGDGDVLDVPGSPRAIHTPGHTEGHCALLFPSHGALFVGDELCTWNPLTGRRGPQLMPKQFDVSLAQCVESLARLEPLEAEAILPGHGDPGRAGPRWPSLARASCSRAEHLYEPAGAIALLRVPPEGWDG
jgi:glyoxylase-like metal-dependent hydrolase (beta-lactamase superfamily II)